MNNFFSRITVDENVMTGKPCIRGMRVTVSALIDLVAAGYSHEQILDMYPYLEKDDIKEALQYAAWKVQERELPTQPL